MEHVSKAQLVDDVRQLGRQRTALAAVIQALLRARSDPTTPFVVTFAELHALNPRELQLIGDTDKLTVQLVEAPPEH